MRFVTSLFIDEIVNVEDCVLDLIFVLPSTEDGDGLKPDWPVFPVLRGNSKFDCLVVVVLVFEESGVNLNPLILRFKEFWFEAEFC